MYKKYLPLRPHHEPLIYRTADCTWIFMNESNTDYQQYLAWLAEGNEPEEWDPDATE